MMPAEIIPVNRETVFPAFLHPKSLILVSPLK